MAPMTRIVTLFGKSLEVPEHANYILFDVLPDLGDAREFGVAGQIRIVERQLREIHHDPEDLGKDILRIPEQVARSVGRFADHPQRRKRP
jgi:hypothetical protein